MYQKADEEGLRKLKKAQEGSRRLKKVPEGLQVSKIFEKVHAGSRWFK